MIRSLPALLAPVAAGIPLTVPAVSFAAAPVVAPAAAAPLTVPAAPSVPDNLPFADRVAGRRLLYDAAAAHRAAPTVRYSATWAQAGNAVPGVAAPASAVTRGAESLIIEPAKRRAVFTGEERRPDGTRRVRRVYVDGERIVGTRFQEKPGGKDAAIREAYRQPLDEGVSAARALAMMEATPAARAADLLFDRPLRTRDSTLWRSGTETVGGLRAEVVSEVEEATIAPRGSRQRARRYAIEPTSRRLLRYEEWDITRAEARARPARGNRPADDGTRVAYRREEYAGGALSSGSLPLSAYAAVVPKNYAEKAPPTVDLPPLAAPTAPDAYDARALALLERWRSAYDRAYTLSAEAVLTLRGADGSPGAVAALTPGMRGLRLEYQVTLQKPDRARVLLYSAGAADAALARRGRQQFPDAALAVSDGQQVRLVETGDSANAAPRTVPLPRGDGASLWNTLQRAGLRDRFGALQYLFNPAPRPEEWDRITYDGPAVLETGEAVEGFTLRRDTTEAARRRRRTVETETITFVRVSIGRDGLPRRIETQRVTASAGGGAVDEDGIGVYTPAFVTDVTLRRIAADAEPPPNAFALPTAPPTARTR